jgi:hypothetical protein
MRFLHLMKPVAGYLPEVAPPSTKEVNIFFGFAVAGAFCPASICQHPHARKLIPSGSIFLPFPSLASI